MAIKIVIDTTEATEEELKNFDELLKDQRFYIHQFYTDKNIKTLLYGEIEKQIAKDNGCTISVALEPDVVLGYRSREEAEKNAREV